MKNTDYKTITPLEAGWDKEDLPEARRSILLKNYGDWLEAARVMRHLANTSKDGYRKAAIEDAAYCFKMHNRQLEKRKIPSYYAVIVFMLLLLISAVLAPADKIFASDVTANQTFDIYVEGGEWADSFLGSVVSGASSFNDISGSVSSMVQMAVMVVPLIGLCFWAFKSQYPVAFQLLSGVTLVIAFQWYNVFRSDSALAFSLAMIVFALVMAITALFLMFKAGRNET